MSFSLGLLDYAIKKGIKKNTIFIVYTIFYLIICSLLIMAMQFKTVGIVAVLIVYLLRILMFKKFLNRIAFS